MQAHLGLFVKEPIPGRVKTRLEPALGPEGAAALYTAMVADSVTLALGSPAENILLFHEGEPPHRWLPADLPGRDSARLCPIPQREGDLGERLSGAVAEAAARGSLPLLLLGSDSPDLPPGQLTEALAALADADVVLGPATDGGVWCIGLARPFEGFFDDLPWSHATTGPSLRNRTKDMGLKLREVGTWSDVDEPADLDRLAARLTRGESRAEWTLRRLLSRPPHGPRPGTRP